MLQRLTVEPSARAVLLYDATAGHHVQNVRFMTWTDKPIDRPAGCYKLFIQAAALHTAEIASGAPCHISTFIDLVWKLNQPSIRTRATSAEWNL